MAAADRTRWRACPGGQRAAADAAPLPSAAAAGGRRAAAHSATEHPPQTQHVGRRLCAQQKAVRGCLPSCCRGRKRAPIRVLQVWGHVDGKLQPLLQIGERTAPALRAVVCEPLGALITAHNGALGAPPAAAHGMTPAVLVWRPPCAGPLAASPARLQALPLAPSCLLPSPRADGQLRLRALPHVRSPAGLNVTFKKDTVFKVSSAALASAQIPMSR